MVRVGSTVGTVLVGLGFLQPREGHRSDDPRIAADAQRPVRGAAGDKVEHQLVVGWEADSEVRGCRVDLVLRAHEEQLERRQDSVVARQEAAFVPESVARQYMLGEGQVTGAQVGWSEAAMAAGEPAVESGVDEPVVREKEPVAKGCVVGFVGHGELRFDW